MTLIGAPTEVFGEMSKPYQDRPDGGGRRPVQTFDVATALLRMADGASGTIQVSRAAWGRKGRLQLQLFGARGAIIFDQENFNEVGVYVAEGPPEAQGFSRILMGPAHPPYERFLSAPGHQMGFNDLKVIEAHELLNRIRATGADHRLRGRPRHRTNRPRDRALEPRGAMDNSGLMAPILRLAPAQPRSDSPELARCGH